MKKFFVIAAAALALVACNKEQKFEAPQAEAIPVGFSAYLNRGVDTKSGFAGEIKDADLQAQGFGVFAYYTDDKDYEQQCTPNFMYNQKVSTASWTYSPVKYWPNEYGNKAESDETDKLSFFAYAPYVDAEPSTGKVADPTNGITQLIRNTTTGDPIVKYVASLDPAKCVDLCWGVMSATSAAAWTIQNTGAAQAGLTAGLPWIDIERPAKVTDPKVKFTFQHALSQLNITIYTAADKDDMSGADVDAKTKVYVRSITLEGFAMKGALNLNNDVANTPKWLDYAGIDDLAGAPVTIYDGRRDGKEGVVGAVASNEKVTGLNEAIIQGDAATTGVTGTAVNLFNSATDSKSIYVIPTGEDVTVSIVYDVETEDANLATLLSDGATYGSSIENKISKTVKLAGGASNMKMEPGKRYGIKIGLGMNSVKFDAEVTDWVDGDGNDPVYLPEN